MIAATIGRRSVLQWFAGGTAWAVGAGPALAGEKRIERLIHEARGFATISQRIDFISSALRGTRYQGYTLIGGPRRPEQFVLRDDAFDCVTYCETVLAAARAQDIGTFENALQEIRYRHGFVNWFERNHYFFEWCQNNVDNKTCRWLDMDGAVVVSKTVDSQKGLSKRRFAMRAIPTAVVLANANKLATGDIVGFVSRRPDLDYFHCGFVVAVPNSPLLLRHAAESRRRVLDESMDRFLARYSVRYVTLLRPEEPAAAVAVKKAI
jgi:N-acetylmuramoyl-L-alanine amidase-like